MIKIAIVDDEVQILEMLENYFSKIGGFTVETYQNPMSAISAIKPDSTDVVLLDIMMPQLDGLQTLVKIRESMPKLPVVMMTAYSTLDRVLSSHQLGADHYLLKPFDSLRVVEKKIKKVLETSR